jgi:2-oxoisovalerate dehydrogenase E1 component alpha subunit
MSFRSIVALGRSAVSRQQTHALHGVRCLSSATDIGSSFGIYGGQKVPYTVDPVVVQASEYTTRSAYRVLKGDGVLVDGAVEPEMSQDRAVELMQLMIRLETMDQVFYDAQRQGRMSFYMTSAGEEAITIGTSSALAPQDMVFAQYREAGVLMYRGFTLQNFADQCFSNADDKGKGRQMPVHYGTAELNYQTISSPLGTQLPQAVGAAYKYKLCKEDRISACYFGEGAASEGE